MSVLKLGRSKKGEERGPLKTITFRVDAETDEALTQLLKDEPSEPGEVRPRSTSAVIRRAILEAVSRKSKKSKTA